MSLARASRNVQRRLAQERRQRKHVCLLTSTRRRRERRQDIYARRPHHLPRGIHHKRTYLTTAASTPLTTSVASPIIVRVAEIPTSHSSGYVPALAFDPPTPDSHSYSSARQSTDFKFDLEAVEKKVLAYWPAWYHQQRQWELQQAELNSTLDEAYRLELVERRWELAGNW